MLKYCLKDVVGLVLGLYFRVTAAREKWLQQYQLLDEQSRLIASRCLRSPCLLQGLVIDDFLLQVLRARAQPTKKARLLGAIRSLKRPMVAQGCWGLLRKM